MTPSPDSTNIQVVRSAKTEAHAAKSRAVHKPHEKPKPEELRKACQEFEEIFLRQILKEAHVDRAGSMGDEEEKNANLYGDMVIETLARSVAKAGGVGIADMLYQQVLPTLPGAEKRPHSFSQTHHNPIVAAPTIESLPALELLEEETGNDK
jgi:peptidoglycan hydrolase FlgJ